jgi:hypothetical protein
VDARVALARRLRHHVHARVEHFLSGHSQAGFAAAEEDREQRPEILVYRVEGTAQELARVAIDAPDRVFERRHRFLQVGRLRIEESLALAARAELLQRRKVHRAKLLDRLREPRDLALKRRRSRRALGFGRELLFVGVRSRNCPSNWS